MMTVSIDYSVRVLKSRALYTIEPGHARPGDFARRLATGGNNRKEINGLEAGSSDQRPVDTG